EVVDAQVEMGAFIAGVLGYQFFEILLLLCYVTVGSGLASQNKEFLPFRRFIHQAHCLLLVLEEILGRRSSVAPRQFCAGKLRIERERTIEVREGVLRKKFFR